MQTIELKAVKVTAPKHFADFLTAVNEPFIFLNGAFYLYQQTDPADVQDFCLDYGVRPAELKAMTFRAVVNPFAFHIARDREAEALEAYRQELAENGRPDMSREAWIANYLETH